MEKFSTVSKSRSRPWRNSRQFQKVGLDHREILDSFKKYVSTVQKFFTLSKSMSRQIEKSWSWLLLTIETPMLSLFVIETMYVQIKQMQISINPRQQQNFDFITITCNFPPFKVQCKLLNIISYNVTIQLMLSFS